MDTRWIWATVLAAVVVAPLTQDATAMDADHGAGTINLNTEQVSESFVDKVETPRTNSNVKERLYVTVINMSGQSRQVAIGDSKIDLPVAQRVTLPVRSGDTLRVVSNTNAKIDERFVISERDAARIIVVQ
jgi:phosphoserine phosphatase